MDEQLARMQLHRQSLPDLPTSQEALHDPNLQGGSRLSPAEAEDFGTPTPYLALAEKQVANRLPAPQGKIFDFSFLDFLFLDDDADDDADDDLPGRKTGAVDVFTEIGGPSIDALCEWVSQLPTDQARLVVARLSEQIAA